METQPQFGICPLGIVPMRAEASDKAEMVNQLLYGELLEVVECQKKWSYVRLGHDQYEGWIDNKQYQPITAQQWEEYQSASAQLSNEFMEMIDTGAGWLSIPLGSRVDTARLMGHQYGGQILEGTQQKSSLIDTALMYMHAPYLWGGRSPFGIDCSGFTQMCYRIGGHQLLRDASQQATQGDALSFIEESEPGDLAFFDNEEGNIIHVGIMLEDNHIIHAHGKVRIDRIDHTGIFNSDTEQHSHKLRVIKRIL